MKKLFSSLLILMLVLCLVFSLTACGKDKDRDDDDDEDEETSDVENETPGDDEKEPGDNKNPEDNKDPDDGKEPEHTTCVDDNGDSLCDVCGLCNGNHSDTDGDGFCNGTDCTYEMPVIDTNGHTLTKVAAVSKTCTANGNIEYYYCESCQTYYADRFLSYPITYDDTIVYASHDIVSCDAYNSCTEISWDAYERCTACDYTTYVEIPVRAQYHKVWTFSSNNLVALNDSYYPFNVSSDGTLTSTNHADGSSSTFTVTATHDFTLSLQYSVSSENGCDYLRIRKNGSIVREVSGSTSFNTLNIDMLAGDIVTFTYSKDGSVNSGSDSAYIKIDAAIEDAIPEILSGMTVTCAADINCQICNQILIPHLPHEYIDHEARPVTCTDIGWNPYQTCANCSYSSYEEISALGHDYIHHDAHSDCTNISWNAYETCGRCEYTTFVEIPATNQYHKIYGYINNPFLSNFFVANNDANYPFELSANGVITSTNHVDSSSSTLTITVTSAISLRIEYQTSSESGCDNFSIFINGSTIVNNASGVHTSWYYTNVTLNENDVLTFTYAKDGSVNTGNDAAYFKLCYNYMDATPDVLSNVIVTCAADLTCDYCSAVVIPHLPHEYINHEPQAPTCTEHGWDAYQTCANCSYSSYEEISALDHDYIYHEARPVTCTEVGWNEYYTCSRCPYTTYVEIPNQYEYHQILSNTIDSNNPYYTITNNSNYPFTYSDGVFISTNKAHGSSSSFTITATNNFTLQIQYAVSSESGYDYLTIRHNSTQMARIAGSYSYQSMSIVMNIGDVVTFTYSKDGSNSHGSDCGYVRIDNLFVDVTADIFEALTPSCDADICCYRCNAVLKPRIEHDYVNHEAQAATCTEYGWDAYQTCSRCDYSSYSQISALDHTYDSHDAQIATCTQIGWNEYYTCSRCDYTTYEEIPMLPHQILVSSQFGQSNNNYSVTGSNYFAIYSGVLTSTNKSHSSSSYYTIRALTAFTITLEYNTSSEGSCDRLTITQNNTTLATASGTGNPWSSLTIQMNVGDTLTFSYTKDSSVHNGSDCAYVRMVSMTYDAIDANIDYSSTEEIKCYFCDLVFVEAFDNHNLVTVEAQAPTCTESGWDEYQTCTQCEYSSYSELAALDHDYVHHDAQAATCTEYGWNAYYTCSRCDYSTYEEFLIPHRAESSASFGESTNNYTVTRNSSFTINGGVLTSTNKSHSSSSYYTITASKSFTIVIQYKTSSESGCDRLTIVKNSNTTLDTESGIQSSWSSLTIQMNVGDTLTFSYTKDGSVNNGSDCAYVSMVSMTSDITDFASTEELICSVCDTVVIEDYDDHVLVDVEANDSTCTEVGNNAYQYCQNCHYTTYEEIALADHTFESGFCTECGAHAPSEGFSFTLSSDGTYYILSSAYYVTDTIVYIPDRHNGLLVKEIAYEAFYNCQNKANITSIIIPNTIEKIGYSAFYNCTSLESIVIPESVTAIAYYAFYNCTSLESVTFEDTANWCVTSSENYWQNKVNGSQINVLTPASNAYIFTTSYGYYWYKN